jgi:molybdopterin/thiamine biosynthesis adenylyltransferase
MIDDTRWRPGSRVEREAERLAGARVLVVGVGALGSAAALTLAAAGIGTLVLMDPDEVTVSNLHRQILHRTATLGAPKVESARDRLARLHPGIEIEAHAEALRPANVAGAFHGVDFVIDATDGASAKFLINDAAVVAGRAFSHAGVLGLRGQTMTVLPGRSACLRCVFPDPPAPDALPTCREAGVLGPVAGVIGSIQGAEAVRTLVGRPLLAGRFLTYEAPAHRWRQVPLNRNPSCPMCAHAQRTEPPQDARAET